MKQNKRKIPYTSCDNCVWWMNSGKLTREEFDKQYKERFPESYQEHLRIQEQVANNPNSEYAAEAWLDYEEMREFTPPHKCPFDYKPNLKSPIRINYKLQCHSCHQDFCCPGDVIRMTSKSHPICDGCIPDYSEDYDEGYDEQKAIDEALVRKYGEC